VFAVADINLNTLVDFRFSRRYDAKRGEPRGKLGTPDAGDCVACNRCVQVCPTGALFNKGSTVGEMERDRGKLEFIVNAREKKQWIAAD